MFVKSQDGTIVLNNDKVTIYRISDRWDGRYKVVARVNDNEFVIGRYSTEEKSKIVLQMISDCHNMNLLFEQCPKTNPRDLFCEYVADQPLGVFEMPQEEEVYTEENNG